MRTKTYKDKGDISYLTFKNFSEVIEVNDSDSFVSSQTMEYFNPSSLESFALALQTEPKSISIPYKVDLDFKTAGKFIDCDTYLRDGQVLEFLAIVLKPKYFWQKVKIESLSIAQVNYIVGLFNEKVTPIKEAHEWIYNPPVFGGNGEITQGSEERQEFKTHYGGYMHMTLLLMKNGFGTIEEITNWSLDKYLFLGEMFNRRDLIENLK
jgi:hypothetical protein